MKSSAADTKKINNPLDLYLKVLYNTFRNSGIAMAIEFKHGGRVWRADTPDEAIALRKRLESDDNVAWIFPEDVLESAPQNTWTHDTALELLRSLGEQQQLFLRLLHDEIKVTGDRARRKLHLSSEVALAGVLSGLSKQVKKLAFSPPDLYSVTVTWDGKDKTRTFQLAKEFRYIASEIGWPEEWDKNDLNSGTTKK